MVDTYYCSTVILDLTVELSQRDPPGKLEIKVEQ